MNVKSMIAGFLIAVVASTGTYFLVPPPSGASALSCASYPDLHRAEARIIEQVKSAPGITLLALQHELGIEREIMKDEVIYWTTFASGHAYIMHLTKLLVDSGVITKDPNWRLFQNRLMQFNHR